MPEKLPRLPGKLAGGFPDANLLGITPAEWRHWNATPRVEPEPEPRYALIKYGRVGWDWDDTVGGAVVELKVLEFEPLPDDEQEEGRDRIVELRGGRLGQLEYPDEQSEAAYAELQQLQARFDEWQAAQRLTAVQAGALWKDKLGEGEGGLETGYTDRVRLREFLLLAGALDDQLVGQGDGEAPAGGPAAAALKGPVRALPKIEEGAPAATFSGG